MSFASTNLKDILPAFPRIAHWPHKPNVDATDIIASNQQVKALQRADVWIEEKIDGASVGMTMVAGEPVIRNRDHILRKGYMKDTAAKKQFRPIWNWWYEKRESFKMVTDAGPYSVYGEWCWAQHGIYYNKLPSFFIAYDIYDFEAKDWLAPDESRKLLKSAMFAVPPLLLHMNDFCYSARTVEVYANSPSAYYDGKAEGVVVKSWTQRYKMVREDFVRGALWDPDNIKKNKLG